MVYIMTIEKIKALANNNEERRTADVSENKEITKVLQISKAYIENFFKSANPQDRAWIMQRLAQIELEVGESKSFVKFRMEFAKKFKPELLAKKSKSGRKSLLERLDELSAA